MGLLTQAILPILPNKSCMLLLLTHALEMCLVDSKKS